MKKIKIIFALLSLSVMIANAQNCPADKVRISIGSKGHGCTCKSKCVDASEVATYQAIGWYVGECAHFCWIGWRTEGGVNPALETGLTGIYPNPASSSATIFFSISRTQTVSFKLFDMTGRTVATLTEEIFEAGDNEFTWNISNTNAGVYFLRMEAGSYNEIKKVLVIK